MTQDEIIRMAREAGIEPAFPAITVEELERFFNLAFEAGATYEREQWKKESEAKDQLALAELHYGVKCK